ncbi:MAG TPA: VOC family protein [Blastocatellia bacterium]|nr:VOC family protein [Blastocatellia bacterium]
MRITWNDGETGIEVNFYPKGEDKRQVVQEALEFYRDKLGFEVRMDAPISEGFRWITVAPKDQTDFEIVLMEPKGGFMFDEAAAAQLRELISKGILGTGVFDTLDCPATYDELSRRGVEFVSPPSERPCGIEAIFKDNSGNWFSLTQRNED